MACLNISNKQTRRKDITCVSIVIPLVLCQFTFLTAEKVHNQATRLIVGSPKNQRYSWVWDEHQSRSFIQTDNVLRYVVDGMPFQASSGKGIKYVQDGASNGIVRFHPPILDFEEQPVGMPKMEQVTVSNIDTEKNLQLLSISGTTVHFHCSFFLDKTVLPRSNTTFDVVFLARQVGNAENTLYIHTSHGTFRYQVFGVGTSNPYRLQPLVGAKLPINSTFSPLIHMYNPHSTAIQVIEMYSSGGDLHLELPSGERDAPKKLWEIPPYETKAVMRASFVGRQENNHTAFIRIKTNETSDEKRVLILPVEVEVTSAPGIYSHVERLDFGIVRTLDAPHTLRLSLINSTPKPVHISSVTVSPANEAVSVEFRPIKLLPGVMRRTQVALVTYTAEKAIHPKQWSGRLLIISRDDEYRLALPYQAIVFHGSLVYDKNNTVFYSGRMENLTKALPLTNTFDFTLVVYNYSMPDHVRKYFSISNFNPPIRIGPQTTMTDIGIQFTPNSTELHTTFDLVLSTNASSFVMPIFVYNGRLKVVHHRPEILKGNLDFGTMGVEEQRSMTFTLRNDNPVDIVISEYSCKMDKTTVELLGVEKGNGTTLTRIHNVSEKNAKPLVLKPFHYAVFSVNLVAPDWEATFVTDVLIHTQFEHLYIPMTLRTAKGSLRAIPEKIVFDKVYPGKVAYKVLRIHSSFTNMTEVREVTFQPKDSRFSYQAPKQTPVVLRPLQDTVIGKVYFDARKECEDDCYVGLSTQTPAGHQWLLGLTLDKEVTDTDQYLYTRFKQKWQILGARDQSTINTTIQLDTNQVWGFLFPAHAHLTWPSLINKSRLKFPLTQIGNTSVMSFLVENGGDVPVLVQALTLSAYPNAATMADLLSNTQLPAEMDVLDDYEDDVFSLTDLHRTNSSAHASIMNQHKSIESQLGVRPHVNTVAGLLQPGTLISVNVGFTPRDDKSQATVILLRNNLTIIDSIIVEGRGATGQMRFSNRAPGSAAPLLFDMTERHLRDCDKKKTSKTVPNFTVRKFFTIKNSGELPFYVHGFNIYDQPCEGYGFRVLNCTGFLLEPNASERIHIIFTPDFTMSRIVRTLCILTTLGAPINFTLQATLPPYMLTKCAAALPRPNWEPLLYYSAISSMVFLLLCILAAAYFEADRIYTADIIQRRYKTRADSNGSTSFDKSKFFDLRKIGSPQLDQPVIDKQKVKTKLELNGENNNNKKVVNQPGQQPQQQATVHKAKNETKNNNTREKMVNGSVRSTQGKNRKREEMKKRRNDERDLQVVEDVEDEIFVTETAVKEEIKTKSKRRSRNNQSNSSTTSPQTLSLNVTSSVVSVPSPRKDNMMSSSSSTSSDVSEPNRLKNQEASDNDGDEVSSTSTESSLDSDERLITRESTPELPQPPLRIGTKNDHHHRQHNNSSSKKNNKKKSSHVRNVYEIMAKNESGDDEFVSTKSKKKSKAEKKLSGGSKSNSFDSPTTKSSDSPRDGRMEPPSPHTIATEATNRTKKAMKNSNNAKLNNSTNKKTDEEDSDDEYQQEAAMRSDPVHVAETESCHSCDSPPPLWDQPGPLPPDGDLSEFALQSEQFALRQIRMPGPPTPEPLSSSSSSRSGSYSSIVSSNTDNGKKLTNGLAAASLSRDSQRSYTLPDMKFPPGPVGSRGLTKPRSHTVGSMGGHRPWTMSPNTTDALQIGLNPIQEMNQLQSMMHGGLTNTAVSMDQYRLIQQDLQTKVMPENQMMIREVLTMTHAGQMVATSVPSPYEPTIMQRLQAERRKRFMEYKERMMKQGEEWPGFGPSSTPTSESLWDTPPYQHQQHPTVLPDWNAELEPTWDTGLPAPGTSSATGWGTLSSIWGSNSTYGSTDTQLLDLNAPAEPSNESLPAFDPFNTLGQIWNPGSGATSGWSLNQNNPDVKHEN